MKDTKRKLPLNIADIILSIIVAPVLFYFTFGSFRQEFFEKILWQPLFSILPDNVALVFLVVLGFDFLWICVVLCIPKYLRIRIYSTLFIITISLAILVFVVVMSGFGKAMH